MGDQRGMEGLDRFFNPQSVVVVGATDREGAVGRQVLENLRQASDRRRVYAVNPSKSEVLGDVCYPGVADLPETADLAVLVTPAKTVAGVVEECGQAGIRAVVIIASGFKETGKAGLKREEKLAEISARHGIRIIGPNCMGVIRPSKNLNTTFISRIPKPGRVAFLSQSGALGAGILDWAISKNLGLSAFVSLGSMLDVDFSDLIDYFGRDHETQSIIIYPESIGDARRFMSAARSFARTKPIIVLKPGRFRESARAVSSHTGAIVTDDMYYDAIFKRAGVVRVNEIKDLFNAASILGTTQPPKGPNLAIVSNGGGPAILATDALVSQGGKLAKLSKDSIAAMNEFLPTLWSKANPVDLLEDATVERFAKAVAVAAKDPGVNGILLIYTPQGSAGAAAVAHAVVAEAQKTRKPVLTAFLGESLVAEARRIFNENRIPTYDFPEEAVRTYLYLHQYARNLEMIYEMADETPLETNVPRNHLRTLIKRTLAEGRTLMREEDTVKFLRTYGLRTTRERLAKDVDSAVLAASDIGFPVALKVSSGDITHKSDIGGVILGLNSGTEVRAAYQTVTQRAAEKMPEARIEGVSIHEMVEEYDYELIVGTKKDRIFGPVIMVGQGGVEAEISKDVAVGIPPLNKVLARRMLEQIRVYEALAKGFRNRPPVNLKKLDELLVKVSDMVTDFPEIQEIDINPVAVRGDTATALDARIILDPSAPSGGTPDYSHLMITPYPTRYVHLWRCRDGRQVLLRPVRPEDEKLNREMLEHLSEETLRFRFFYVLKEITHEMLTQMCNIDYDREVAIVAEYEQNGKRRNVGIGRILVEPDGETGEFAVLVADDFQNNGLGLKLTDAIIGVAEDKGLKSIYGILLNDNAKMRGMVERLGFTVERISSGESKLTLEL